MSKLSDAPWDVHDAAQDEGASKERGLFGKCLAVLRGLAPYTRGHWRWFAFGACAAMGVVAARLILPWPLRVVADRWLAENAGGDSWLLGLIPNALDPVLAMGAVFFLLIFTLGLSDFLERFYFARFSVDTVRAIRSAAFFCAIRGRTGNRAMHTDLVSRLVDDTARIKTGLQGFLVRVATNGTVFLGMTIVLFIIDVGLGLIFTAAGLATAVVTAWAAARTFENSLLQRAKESKLASEIEEAFQNGSAEGRPLKTNDGVFEATQTKLQGIATWTTHGIFGVAVLAALWVGAAAVDAGRIAAGDMVVFMMYALTMRGPIVRLARQGCRTGKALATGYRLIQLLSSGTGLKDERCTPRTEQQ